MSHNITRIVKMTFDPARVNDFLSVFNENRDRIAGFEGCMALELHHELSQPNVFFTISKWRSENDLEQYRSSELFQKTWARTKTLFAAKPEAWTLARQ